MPRILYIFEEKINKNWPSFITVHCHGSWWMRLHVTFPPPTGCVMSNLTDSYNHYFYRDVNTKYYLASQKVQNIALTTEDGCMMRKRPIMAPKSHFFSYGQSISVCHIRLKHFRILWFMLSFVSAVLGLNWLNRQMDPEGTLQKLGETLVLHMVTPLFF